MCGILAYYNPKGISKKNIEESLLSLEKIKHRGPDGEGIVLINTKSNTFKTIQTRDTPEAVYTDTTLANINDFDFDLLLGHRRLSIFDLSTAGHQPMQGKNSSWITYNGEIYNFFEIRAELEDLGHTFKTNTDTEVILTAYQEWGHNGLSKFNGMWAFILWDGQQLFVSNDRFGVKPLYYYQNESELIFFSETKQILAFPGRVTEYNHNTIRTFLNDSYLELNNQTFFQNVLRFPNSSYSQILLSDFKNKTLETHLFLHTT